MDDRYTFGDSDRAAARLRRLAELYEPVTRSLLLRGGGPGCEVAADLGCGPGWTTRLLHEVLGPRRTVGLDASERYVAEARRLQPPALEFVCHDVTAAPFPVRPELLLCRFILTHLRDTDAALAAWASAAAPSARLLVHETESLSSGHPALARYYELIARLQRHYGQHLDVGARLDSALERSPWRVLETRAVRLELPAARMAELHLANLRTWRDDPHARSAFDAAELASLEDTLARIVDGTEPAGSVANVVRQVVAERRG
ncbi:MAG TPA: class I SAM-dependent methyltransferase [Anaeromyxobacteraceae bacterium]|nr:class I SAM-dependent methyltransferase [Anaeromyxobacteraceae bacterium]